MHRCHEESSIVQRRVFGASLVERDGGLINGTRCFHAELPGCMSQASMFRVMPPERPFSRVLMSWAYQASCVQSGICWRVEVHSLHHELT